MISKEDATAGLIAAAKQFPGAHCCDGESHPWLMQAAQEHADRQAHDRQCGSIKHSPEAAKLAESKKLEHQMFSGTFVEEAEKQTGCTLISEIAAESWPEQIDADGLTLGMDAFNSWRASPGHWRTACVAHKYYGAGLACGANGLWYSTILSAD